MFVIVEVVFGIIGCQFLTWKQISIPLARRWQRGGRRLFRISEETYKTILLIVRAEQRVQFSRWWSCECVSPHCGTEISNPPPSKELNSSLSISHSTICGFWQTSTICRSLLFSLRYPILSSLYLCCIIFSFFFRKH